MLFQGVETKLKHQLYPVLISATHVAELAEVHQREDGIYFGGATTLTCLEEALRSAVEKIPSTCTFEFISFRVLLWSVLNSIIFKMKHWVEVVEIQVFDRPEKLEFLIDDKAEGF